MSFKDFLKSHNDVIPTTSRDETLDALNSAAIAYIKSQLRVMRGTRNQAEIAEAAGLRQPAISRIENSDITRLSLPSLQMIAAALDCVVVIELKPRAEILAEIHDE